jgi:hypothetical protein
MRVKDNEEILWETIEDFLSILKKFSKHWKKLRLS